MIMTVNDEHTIFRGTIQEYVQVKDLVEYLQTVDQELLVRIRVPEMHPSFDGECVVEEKFVSAVVEDEEWLTLLSDAI